jgi:hypothetical protein
MIDNAECRLCGEPIKDYVEGSWCFGCGSFICENHPQNPWGSHNPEAHDSTGPEDDE